MARDDAKASNAERLYEAVRDMAIAFDLKPGERIVEGALAEQLGASRTPLREALNRLVAENYVVFRPGVGFFCRDLDPKEIFDLYELRLILEAAAADLACARADDAEIADVIARHQSWITGYAASTTQELVANDEAFHEDIASLSGNRELVLRLRNINGRIRFVRWIDADAHLATTRGEHGKLLEALKRRDKEACRNTLFNHIAKRQDQVMDAVRACLSRIYMPEGMTDAGRRRNVAG
ncbi:MAG: GntR family transcriptional regulator [Hyphomicrobiales bacterium]|nr:GntR family transcriptional regulator [Hyphomicrobiales bacterium]